MTEDHFERIAERVNIGSGNMLKRRFAFFIAGLLIAFGGIVNPDLVKKTLIDFFKEKI